MSEYFIKIRNDNRKRSDNISDFDNHSAMLKLEYQVKSSKNKTKKNGNRCRIQMKACCEIAFK